MMIELLWTLPFVVLLGSIAVVPLINKEWWERRFAVVSFALAALVAARYFLAGMGGHMLGTLQEYLSFILLIGSLFVVSGGIHITVKGEAPPRENALFLLVAALFANIIGTTGASMVFIRPWLRMNRHRLAVFHVVFFVFLVSNIGGSLTPIGDPPLFLGYLRGIPFFWTLRNLWPAWLAAMGILLAVFFMLDERSYKAASQEERAHEEVPDVWKVRGKLNFVFLAAIIGAVFITRPLFLREAVMFAAAVLSYLTTSKKVHKSNEFDFAPIKEVAVLFFGIFVTMVPALEWLQTHAAKLGIYSPGQFFWGAGALSSVLDNAPTYLNFMSAAAGVFGTGGSPHGVGAGFARLAADHATHVVAISVACVFFGAMTYIGNGPNFLVKSMAERARVKMPSFFGYIVRYSIPLLLPVFILLWAIFFKN